MNQQKIKISVVIPVYNGEKWVAQCIENLLCQTHKDLEIIVVDDGSTDRTAEIAARYSVAKLIRRENGGLAAARNTGIDAATGDYIHFMDVDDFTGLNFYERMLDAAIATDAEMASCEFVHEAFPDCSLYHPCRMVLTNAEDKLTITDSRRFGSSCKWLFKSSLLNDNKLRFFEDRRMIEDIPFTLQALLLASRVVTVPGAVYVYKNREGSIMRTRDPEAVKLRREAIRKSSAFCNELLGKHNLAPLPTPTISRQVFKYKLLGIPMLKKYVDSNGTTKWYILGIRILRKSPPKNITFQKKMRGE